MLTVYVRISKWNHHQLGNYKGKFPGMQQQRTSVELVWIVISRPQPRLSDEEPLGWGPLICFNHDPKWHTLMSGWLESSSTWYSKGTNSVNCILASILSITISTTISKVRIHRVYSRTTTVYPKESKNERDPSTCSMYTCYSTSNSTIYLPRIDKPHLTFTSF